MTNATRFAYVFGVTYLVVGLLGFVVTGISGFLDTEGESLLGFGINPLHNLVHVLIGGVLVAAAVQGGEASRLWTRIVGAVLGLVGILGFFIVGTPANILALNVADNLLHLATALVAAVALTTSPRPSSA
jgi:hypothetical protein